MSFRRFFAKKLILLSLFFAFFQINAFAAEPENSLNEAGKEEAGAFNFKETTFHHLLDAYSWEFFRKADGEPVKIDLPRILWNDGGLHFYGSTEKAVEAGYVEAHHFKTDAKHGELLTPAASSLEVLKEEMASTSDPNHKGALEKDLDAKISAYTPLDFSITKNVLFIFIAAALMLIIFISVGNAYKKRPNQAPRGMQSLFETVVQFIRDEVVRENIPHGYERFMPLLLTMFFFIWFLNMLGMVPFAANVTGNISVTLSLALVTLIVTNLFANKHYWKHIFWPPVPHWVKIILIPVEIIGILTKPFALTIRLFANMTAGHVIAISLLALIFIFGKMGQAAAMGFGTGVFSTLFIVAISLLELFVAALQAYVFTLLTSVFIGQAVEEAEHH